MLKLFALAATRSFGASVARDLGTELAEVEERDFEDGEHKARPLVEVRGADAYVIHSLHGEPRQSPNDKLCRLLFFIAALKTNGASRVTAVVPYLAYARKDRQTKPRDPVTTQYVARLFEAVGTDRMVTLDVHNLVAFQNAFRCESVALDLRGVLLDRAAALSADGPVAVASPDPGGVKRAQIFREALEERTGRPVGFALMEKRRSAGVVSGTSLAGEVAGARVLVVDDLIASGGTMVRAAAALRTAGARDVWALAAHGLFTGDAGTALTAREIAGWIVTDTVGSPRLAGTPAADRIETVSAAPLFARAIARLHGNRGIIDLPAGGS